MQIKTNITGMNKDQPNARTMASGNSTSRTEHTCVCNQAGTDQFTDKSSQIWGNSHHSVFYVVIQLCSVVRDFYNLCENIQSDCNRHTNSNNRMSMCLSLKFTALSLRGSDELGLFQHMKALYNLTSSTTALQTKICT